MQPSSSSARAPTAGDDAGGRGRGPRRRRPRPKRAEAFLRDLALELAEYIEDDGDGPAAKGERKNDGYRPRYKPKNRAEREADQPDPIRLPGVPITDPAWAEARRGKHPGNYNKLLPPEPLTVGEVIRLHDACHLSRPAGHRDQALIVLLWRSGLRAAEALDLYPRDVNLEKGTIRVKCGKGSKHRLVGIDPVACQLLGRWMTERARVGIPRSRPLFCTTMRDERVHGRRYRRLSYPCVVNMLKRLAKRAGVDRRVTPHSFRHTMADEWVDEGIPLPVLQEQLGHEHLESTEAYVRKISAPELIARARARRWPDAAAHLLAA